MEGGINANDLRAEEMLKSIFGMLIYRSMVNYLAIFGIFPSPMGLL
jgi:hypothetical protein